MRTLAKGTVGDLSTRVIGMRVDRRRRVNAVMITASVLTAEALLEVEIGSFRSDPSDNSGTVDVTTGFRDKIAYPFVVDPAVHGLLTALIRTENAVQLRFPVDFVADDEAEFLGVFVKAGGDTINLIIALELDRSPVTDGRRDLPDNTLSRRIAEDGI